MICSPITPETEEGEGDHHWNMLVPNGAAAPHTIFDSVACLERISDVCQSETLCPMLWSEM